MEVRSERNAKEVQSVIGRNLRKGSHTADKKWEIADWRRTTESSCVVVFDLGVCHPLFSPLSLATPPPAQVRPLPQRLRSSLPSTPPPPPEASQPCQQEQFWCWRSPRVWFGSYRIGSPADRHPLRCHIPVCGAPTALLSGVDQPGSRYDFSLPP